MSPRALSIFNTIGCLILTALVITQWRRERAMDHTITTLGAELQSARNQVTEEAKHRAALERDIGVLKESIETTQQAAESSVAALAEKELLATGLQNDLTATREQITVWETALKERDERIQTLDANLNAARKRLDEAISQLKNSGER